MPYPIITNCPVCQQALRVTRLECNHCHTVIENEFQLTSLASLSKEQLSFVEVFLKCRGNIKEVEKELGISYPTVRGKLDEIIETMGYVPKKKRDLTEEKKIVTMLENGEITPEEAIKLLKDE